MTASKQSAREQVLVHQLLGLKLLAKEISDEIQTVRHHVNLHSSLAQEYVDAVESLARIDGLLEPILSWEDRG
jgi:hypothetical protein